MALAADPVFVSTHHPESRVAEVGHLEAAVLVGPRQVAFVDGVAQTLSFVDVATGVSWTAPDDGMDPVFGPRLRLLDRSQGRVATDRNGSVALFNSDGEVIERITYEPGELSVFAFATAIAMFPDRRLLFRRVEKAPSGFSLAALAKPDGLQRDTVRYETPVIGEKGTLVARAPEDERMFLSVKVNGVSSMAAEPILFGQRLLEARAGEHLVIVQTDRPEIVVHDRSGAQVSVIPMPGRQRPVTEDQRSAQRELRMAEMARRNELTELVDRARAARFGVPYSTTGDSIRISRLPANDVAPPVDRIIGDLDGRIWLRMYAMPGDTVVYWRVWQPGQDEPDFEISLPRSRRLLDASGVTLLLGTSDNLDGPGFSLQEMVGVTQRRGEAPAGHPLRE